MSQRKSLTIALLCGLALLAAGCSRAPSALPAVGKGPAATAAPSALPTPALVTPTAQSPAPGGALAGTLSGQCNLLNSQDLSHFYSSAEVTRAAPQKSQVSHPAFSTASLAATEVACTFYVFHRPGHSDVQMLQINYWVDVPSAANASAWAQAWAQAKAGTVQAVPGLGDDAFYANGRLTFKKGTVYVTVEALNVDTTTAGNGQQIDIEKQVALDTLSRLG